MTILEIILVSYIGIILLGTIIQIIIEERYAYNTLVDVLMIIVVQIPIFFLSNLFFIPFIGIRKMLKTQRNPIPNCFTIDYFNENTIDDELFALGFDEVDHRVSVDNIPYSGYAYFADSETHIIIANDYYSSLTNSPDEPEVKQRYLRVSIYKSNSKTKFIESRLRNINRYYSNIGNMVDEAE